MPSTQSDTSASGLPVLWTDFNDCGCREYPDEPCGTYRIASLPEAPMTVVPGQQVMLDDQESVRCPGVVVAVNRVVWVKIEDANAYEHYEARS